VPPASACRSWRAPNCDTTYYYAAIDGRGTYRLSGIRGGAMFANVSLGPLWQLSGQLATVRGNHALDSLRIDADGRFSVIISEERPAGHDGDWWPLDPAVEALGLREVFYRSGEEAPSRVALERLDVPGRVEPCGGAEREARMLRLVEWVRGQTLMWLDHSRKLAENGQPNVIGWQNYGGSGVPGQAYYEGVFELDPGEALVFETAVPDPCRYWSVLLADRVFSTVDWINHQSSLNGAQARLDADGRFRAVIALSDPGVPNWLDPAGLTQGIVQGRWLGCEDTPLPTLARVPLAALRDHLPPDTPAVLPVERDAAMRARRVGAHLSGIL